MNLGGRQAQGLSGFFSIPTIVGEQWQDEHKASKVSASLWEQKLSENHQFLQELAIKSQELSVPLP